MASSKPGTRKPQPKPAGNAPAIDIGIGAADRKRVADGLSHFLADSYTLYLKTHNFHWNVTGPMFNALHVRPSTPNSGPRWTGSPNASAHLGSTRRARTPNSAG